MEEKISAGAELMSPLKFGKKKVCKRERERDVCMCVCDIDRKGQTVSVWVSVREYVSECV